MKKRIYMVVVAAAVSALAIAAVTSQAQTVTTETSTQQSAPPIGGKIINLGEFDLNKDNLLSTFEIGEMVFKFFDTDANAMIDEAEYERRSILTVAPMETTTTASYDYNNDGIADKTQYTFDTFTQETQLARFDKNKDGLTPHEFIDKPFAEIDIDAGKGLDVTEWRNAYVSRLAPAPVQ